MTDMQLPVGDAATTGTDRSTGLRRNALSPFEVLSATLANLAPVEGLFLSITLVAAAMGTRAPFAFLIAGVAIAATGNTLAEFSKLIPSAGSFVTFIGRSAGGVSKPGGNFLATMTYYMLMISYPVTIAAVVVFLGSWLQIVFNLPNVAWLLISLGVLVVTTPLLLRRVGLSAKVAFAMFTVEATGLIVLSVALLADAGTHVTVIAHNIGGTPGGFGGLSGITFALAVSGFIGWENSGPLAEEARDPRKAIPRTIFTSIGVIMVLYFLASWAAASGFIAWKGTAGGASALENVANAAPFLDLSRHFTPWWTWAVGLIGVTSAFGCYIAAATSQARITYNGAREGLLPPVMAKVTRQQAPIGAILLYVAITALLVAVPYFWLNTSAITVFSDEAGVGTVPILLVYLIANLCLPIYLYRAHRRSFSWVRHVLVPLVGSAVLAYGIYEFVLPSQPPPANHYWIFILAIVAVSALTAVMVILHRPAAAERVGRALAE